jgi:hypothetical protein
MSGVIHLINYVKAPRLSWFGHINRTPEISIVKKIHKWKRFTNRPLGRLKSRWEEYIRNDLKKMKVIEWTEQVQDRLKRKAIVVLTQKKKKKKKKRKRKRRRYLLALLLAWRGTILLSFLIG